MDTAVENGLAQHLGRVVPVSFDPALLALSYIISLVGSASTLELIQRRTSRRGYYNNLLLLAAAFTMGGVAIWSMHYIGNRATTLLDGQPEVQIAYSAGVTAASFFVPIVVLMLAFFVVTITDGSSNRVSWRRVGISGTLSGGAISGMHYLGNASISNYRCDYLASFVVGSVVIAAAASTIALSLFFVFKSSWTNSWWKRTGCAVVLAGAVSGMHWCAVMGTRYTLTRVHSTSETTSRNTTVIVTACLAAAACFTMAGIAIYSARVRKGYASRAQRVTLAAAVFDQHGRILVTPDGLLPSEVVTSTFLQKTQNEIFSTAHPLFHWLFQASRNWPSISTLLDKMHHHLANLPHQRRSRRTEIELVDHEGHIIDNYDTIFCELFCVAAAALSQHMHQDLVDAGVLWDEILATGGPPTTGSLSELSATTSAYSRGSEPSLKQDPDSMAERGMTLSRRGGHGHLMFLVRKVDSSHVEHLTASGYCFAEPRQVAHIIGSKMQIRTTRLEQKLRGMERYARGTMLDPGVHLGLFAVRTHVHQMGFDVLVRRQARNLLPSLELPLDRLEASHAEFLRTLDGMTITLLLRQLERTSDIPARDASFAVLLHDAIRNLRASVQDPAFDAAKLLAQVVQVPCAPRTNGTRPSTCSMIVLSIMIPIHIRVDAPAHEFVPLQFFKTQQLVYQNSPHKAAFARAVHRNLSPILDSVPPRSVASLPPPSRLRDYVSLHGRRLLSLFRRRTPRNPYSPVQARQRHADVDKPVSASREHVALTPCNQSVASLALYGEAVPVSMAPAEEERKLPSGGGGGGGSCAETAQAKQTGKQQPPKRSYGGIMVSQEVTVDVEEVQDAMPDMPPATHRRDSSNGGPPVSRRKSLRVLQNDQAIELADVSPGFGISSTRIEVKKEGDNDAVTTFVDELFSTCLDTPRRM